MPSDFVDEVLRPFWGLWLMGVFVVIVVAAFWPGNRARLEEHGGIPLRDDEEQEGAPWHR